MAGNNNCQKNKSVSPEVLLYHALLILLKIFIEVYETLVEQLFREISFISLLFITQNPKYGCRSFVCQCMKSAFLSN